MASAIVGHLRAILSLDTAEFSSSAKQVAASMKTMSSQFSDIGRQATAVGSALTKTITLPMVAVGAGAVKMASDFESSFAGVRKTVEATEPEFAALAQGLRDMAKDVGFNVNDLNRVAEAAGQLGIKKDDIIAFTRTMADLSVTTNLTAEEAATATAQFQNIFGAAGKDVDKFGSALVALGNAGASTEKGILDMGLRIAGAGRQVGLTQAQVLAFASSLSSVGINAEAGGSAISRVFLKINDAVAKGGSGLSEFARVSGMSAGAFKQAWEKDAAAATVAFIGGLARLKGEGENVNTTIEGLVGKNIIIKDTLLRASGSVGMFTDNLKLADDEWQRNTALTIEANERYKTFENQLGKLWAQVRDVGITLGTALLPTMRDLIAVVAPLVDLLGKAATMFAALPEPVRLTAVGIAAAVAAVGPMLWAFGTITTSIGTVIKAFTAKGIAMRALTALMNSTSVAAIAFRGALMGIGSASAVVATAFASWHFGKWIGEFTGLTNVVGYLSAKLGELVGILPKGAAAQYTATVRAMEAAKAAKEQAAALDGAADATNDLADANAFIGPILDRNANGIDDFAEAAEDAKKKAEAFAESLKKLGGRDAIAGAQEVVKQLHALGGPLKVLPSQLEAMAARMREGAEAALLMGKADLANQYAKLADTLDPVIQFQQRYNVTLGEYVTKAPAAANWTSEITDQLHRLAGTATTIGPALKNAFDFKSFMGGSMFSGFKQAVTENLPDPKVWSEAWDSMKDGLKMTLAGIPQTLANAFTGGGDIMGAIKSIVSQVGASIGGAIGSAFGPLGQQIGSALGSMAGLLVAPFKKIFGIGVNDAIKKANKEIGTLRDELIATHGPLEVLEAKARIVGLSFSENWRHQGEAGLAAFRSLVEEFNTRWAALEAQRDDFTSEIDGLIQKGRDLGYEFNSAGEFIGVTFDAVKKTADDFGVSIEGLGPKFAQQQLDAEAQKVVNAFTLMDKAGGSTGGILVGLKDEIGAVVGQAIAMGGTVPKQFEPWVKELHRTGQLMDENGVAITDLSKVTFGEPVADQFETISNALLDVVAKLQAILDQIAAIPTNKTVTIQPQWGDPGPQPDWATDGARDPGHSVGTLGRYGSWFKDFGAGFRTSLHGMEAVVTQQQAPSFAMDVLSGMGGMTPAMAGDNGQLLSEIRGLRRDLLTTLPAISETAARHGAQTSGRRR